MWNLEDMNKSVLLNLKDFFKSQDIINIVDDNTYDINIQPKASILNVFSRLNYKAWYAIAEFVDNSTQSYISNEQILKSNPNFEKLKIKINYDIETNTLVISDNAYGMEIDRFKDAILLDAKNENQTGRNEFGMGLKTAASWFGEIWNVSSTQYGSENKYEATVDIPYLKESDDNTITISRTIVNPQSHGTTITIKNVTKKITAARTRGKIIELLSSMYRRDINNRNIEIQFDDNIIQFESFPILKFREKEWKKPVDFVVNFENKQYRVDGFVAIMDPGSFIKAGFALFRQDRVVIGGPDQNYKPSQIFGQAQDTRSHKLFGELNMNDFPVNQAKDGFVWDDGLEDAFVEELRKNIQEYIEIAAITVKDRIQEDNLSKATSQKIQDEVTKSVGKLSDNGELIEQDDAEDIEDYGEDSNEDMTDLEQYKDNVQKPQNSEPTKVIEHNRTYDIKINNYCNKHFVINWAIGSRDYWFDIEENEDTINILININHPFFKPYSNENDFQIVLEKFVIAFIMAEQQAKISSNEDGYVLPATIRHKMNKFLAQMEED